MCMATPMRIVEVSGGEGTVELGQVRRKVSLALLPGAKVGAYVLVHAGFAIGEVDEEEARLTLEAIGAVAAEGQDRNEGREGDGDGLAAAGS